MKIALAVLAVTMSLQGQQPVVPTCTAPNTGAKCDPSQLSRSLGSKEVIDNGDARTRLYAATDTFIGSVNYVHPNTALVVQNSAFVEIVRCDVKEGVPVNCVIAKGHTLDEVMQVLAASLKVRI